MPVKSKGVPMALLSTTTMPALLSMVTGVLFSATRHTEKEKKMADRQDLTALVPHVENYLRALGILDVPKRRDGGIDQHWTPDRYANQRLRIHRMHRILTSAHTHMAYAWDSCLPSSYPDPSISFQKEERGKMLPDRDVVEMVQRRIVLCKDAGKTHMVMFLFVNVVVDRQQVGHTTLVHFDFEKRTQLFWDPHGDNHRTIGDMRKLNLAPDHVDRTLATIMPYFDFRTHQQAVQWGSVGLFRTDAQSSIEPHRGSTYESGWCNYVCNLVYTICHRFQYFNLSVVGSALKAVFDQLFSRSSLGVLGCPGDCSSYPKGPLFDHSGSAGAANPLFESCPSRLSNSGLVGVGLTPSPPDWPLGREVTISIGAPR
jgi:hypothetical protein